MTAGEISWAETCSSFLVGEFSSRINPIAGASLSRKQLLKSALCLRERASLVGNTRGFISLCAAEAGGDARGLARQKAGLFSVSGLLVVARQLVHPILPYGFQVEFSVSGAWSALGYNDLCKHRQNFPPHKRAPQELTGDAVVENKHGSYL